jgi:salicylate hydroxylase
MGSESEKTNNTKSFEVAIIGGGLGGLCLAICLLRHHVPLHIYEAAPSFGEIGAGIMFGPHAVNALRLISPEALAAFQRCATFNQDESMKWSWPTFRFGINARNSSGQKMGDVEWQVLPDDDVQRRSELCGTRTMSTVHRARFLDEMVSLVPKGATSFNKALDRLEQTDRYVTMYFTDGTEAHADAVIGCDGIKSKVRSSIMKDAGFSVEPQYVGEYAYRSLVDVEIAKSVLGERLAVNANLGEGYGGYLIHYPVENGRLVNVVGVAQDNGQCGGHSYERLVTPVPREKMYDDWKDWDPRLQRLLRELKSSDQWSLWHLQHGEKYFRRYVCLLGDAAHASTPHLGSGAGMAIEDAYILGNLLSSVTKKADLQRSFAAYDAVRRPRTQKLVAKSREAGQKHSLVLPGVEDDIRALHTYSKAQYRWVWGFDLEQQLHEAKGICEEPRAPHIQSRTSAAPITDRAT